MRMAAISLLNPKAEFARAAQALAVNISAAKGIQDVMKTNLGPKGTMKMYVSDSRVRFIPHSVSSFTPIVFCIDDVEYERCRNEISDSSLVFDHQDLLV